MPAAVAACAALRRRMDHGMSRVVQRDIEGDTVRGGGVRLETRAAGRDCRRFRRACRSCQWRRCRQFAKGHLGDVLDDNQDQARKEGRQRGQWTMATTSTTPMYLACLKKCDTSLKTSDGQDIAVWELAVPVDSPCLCDWASRFRQHYCLDSEIDVLRAGTGLSRAEYLVQLVFPDESKAPGPGIRSGDFAELLISDYVEYRLEFWVPRGKYAEKASRDESVKGVDILGFRGKRSPAPS